jgi:NAD(P)-dependent dehydrogenase (short-subunit alcohol dehydrogenase family)
MAGLDPAISSRRCFPLFQNDVDHRVKPGDDDWLSGDDGARALTNLPSFDLTGQVALVTGASSGIGRHLAELLAAAGAKVALAARRADRLAELAEEIATTGGHSLPIACDVTKAESVAAAVSTAENELGGLSILVNNAGVVVSKPLFDHTEADWDYVVDTNLKGAWLAAREFAHHLVGLKRPGRIINISSVLGYRTIGRVPAYCAAKAGLTHLTHVLAMELARYGILVNALAPGYVETDFNRAFFQTEAGKALISRVPLKRLGQTEDLDGALLFLASPASAYVTGAVIAVDGGHGVAAI